MPKFLWLDIAWVITVLPTSVILLLFAFQKMPENFQKVFNDSKVASNKAIIIISTICLIGVFFKIYELIDT